jgi:autotransporter-associated beta strand protein
MNSDSYIGVDGGATLVVSNTISGVAQLYAIGSGTLALAVPNSYMNGTTLNGPVIDIDTNGALGTGPVSVVSSGRFVLATGVNFTNFLDAIIINPGSGLGLLMVNDNTNGAVTTISGPLEFDATSSSGGNFVGPTTSGYLDVTGPITNDATGEIVVRSGLMRFSGGGSYTLFDLSGTTSLGADNGLSTNAIVNVGVAVDGIVAIFDLNGFNQTLTGLADGGDGAELVTNSAKARATLTLNVSSSATYGGPIGGNISVVVEGSANQELAGTNSYTGNTTVLGGSLELGEPTLAATSTVTITNGAYLQLDFSTTNKVSALVLNGVSQPKGVYNSTTSPQYIIGSGSLQVASALASSPTNITYSVSGTTLTLSWPPAYLGWLVQSNSVNLGVSADWQDMSNTAAGTTFNVTVNRGKGQVFYRLRHP